MLLWEEDECGDMNREDIIELYTMFFLSLSTFLLYPLSTVYLPHGVWKDGIDGSLRKGSRWIHHYRVAYNQVAYFIKMPDNTRF